MATHAHTPHGRGYDESLLYFHHCVDYWTQTPSIGCPNGGGSSTTIAVTDLWENGAPSHSNGSSSCGTVRQPLATCDCSSCDGCANASDYPTPHGGTGAGRILRGPYVGTRYVDDVFAARAVRAVLQHPLNVSSPPLFLVWAPHAAHTPLQVPQVTLNRFVNITDSSSRRVYSAMVAHADAHVATLIAALKSRGDMWSRTLLVFASDNGGPIYNNGTPGASNFPLRGGKMSNWEGGIRVPAFVSGGAIAPARRGTKSSALSALWDWYATFAELAGVDDFDHRAAGVGLPPIDSVSLVAALGLSDAVVLQRRNRKAKTARMQQQVRTELAIGTPLSAGAMLGGQPLVVQGLIHGSWKLMFGTLQMSGWQGTTFPNASTNWLAQRDVHDCGNAGCLFDLALDPTEHSNVAAQNPDVVVRMRARILALNATAYLPERGVDNGGACRAAIARGLVFGPWL